MPNPFNDCECEAEAILIVGYLFGSIILLVLLMVLMIYFYVKIVKILPMLIIFLFSIVIGMISFTGSIFPFSPWFQLFFILFQTILFYLKLEKINFKIK